MNNNILSSQLYTALITPFNKENKIDFPSLKNLLLRQNNANAGIIILGSTAEGISLSQVEKKQIIDFTCEMNLSSPIIVGISGFYLPDVIDIINHCNDKNIAGFLAPTPIYSKPLAKGQTAWFKAIANATNQDIMLYNIPSRAATTLYPQVVENLSHYSRINSIKESSGDINQITAYKNANKNINVFCGEDHLLEHASKKGAVGLISVMSNIWPTETLLYVKLLLSGKSKKEIDPDNIWQNMIVNLQSCTNPISVKEALFQLNIISNNILRLPLLADDNNIKIDFTSHNTQIKNWYNNFIAKLETY